MIKFYHFNQFQIIQKYGFHNDITTSFNGEFWIVALCCTNNSYIFCNKYDSIWRLYWNSELFNNTIHQYKDLRGKNYNIWKESRSSWIMKIILEFALITITCTRIGIFNSFLDLNIKKSRTMFLFCLRFIWF